MRLPVFNLQIPVLIVKHESLVISVHRMNLYKCATCAHGAMEVVPKFDLEPSALLVMLEVLPQSILG